jgi:hypothetical protein
MDNENSATLSGFMADLTQLTNILASISHDSHFWSCPRNLPDGARQIIVRYTNPIYPGLPNDLSFGFPVLHEPIWFYPARETTYACLSPYVAHPIQTGLYLEHGTLKEDALEDWNVFWPPLCKELRRRVSLAVCVELNNLGNCGGIQE